MQYFLFISFSLSFTFHIIIHVSVADENQADQGLFANDDIKDFTALVPDLDSNFNAGDNPVPAENLDLFYSSSNVENEPNIDLFAAGCSATDTDKLVSREEQQLLCPSNEPEPKVPRLPTFVPPSEKPRNSPNGVPLLNDPALTGDDGVCPPEFRYHLCCICNGLFHYDFCQDCLSSK